MQHIAFISHGKDSLAMLEAIKILGLPLDRIITVDIWATRTIRGELPEMVDHKESVDKKIFERYGIKVEHWKSACTFEEQFYEVKQNGKQAGNIYGFPHTIGAWCNSRLKIRPINTINNICDVKYLGIASDEAERIERHKRKEGVVLPLVELGWTEKECYEFCETNGLLAPNYKNSYRDGCWFCPKQPIKQLRLLRNNYPDLWSLLMKWDLDSPVPFKPDGHTVHDYDKRFTMEEEGIISPDDQWKWGYLSDTPLQIHMIF